MTKPLLHAHFDCFGGAAGDMMLAACIDAADSLPFPLVLPPPADTHAAADNVGAQGSNSERLLSRLIFDLENGMPELKGEFRLSSKRVWRSAGRIAARKVDVSSVYDHEAAPVPGAGAGGCRVTNDMSLQNHHDHGHSHQNAHDHTHHSSSSELKEEDDNDIDDGSNNVLYARDDHSHNHSHSRSSKDDMVDGHQSHDHHHHHHEHSHSHDHNHSHGHGHDHHHSNNSSSSSSSSPGKLRNLPQISKMLASSFSQYIPTQVVRLSIDTFTALAHAEMHAHGSASIDDVHFHEVGAVDSIVDTVGTLLALYHLGVDLGGRKGQTGKKSSGESVDDNEGDNRAPTIAVTCSALPLGEGTVMTDHGLLPVPAPAALRLMIGMPTCPGPSGPTGELVTPTAAALLRVLTGIDSGADFGNRTMMPSSDYWQPMRVPGRPPRMKVRAVGLGAGSKDFERHANILRLILGDTDDARKRESIHGGGSNSSDVVLQPEEVTNQIRVGEESRVPMEDARLPGNVHSAEDMSHVTTGALDEQTTSKPWDMHTLTHIEANIDDATSELLAHALNLLLENGAIDAWIHPIIMKKGRPAHSLHCICRSDSTEHSNDEERLLNIMFRHTTTVGIRIHRNILRAALKRRFVEVKLPYTDNSRCGRVDVKISSFNDGQIISVKPEFDHCKVVSEESDIPLKVVSLEAENMGRMFTCEHLS